MIAFGRMFSLRLLSMGIAIFVAGLPLAGSCDDDAATLFVFAPHALAYAQEHPGSVPIDPQVFVEDPNAPDSIGPQGIHHSVGLRPARLADNRLLPLFDADGDPLSLSLGHWLASKGTARTMNDSNGMRVQLRFSHLVPFGLYSIFLSKSASEGNVMAPLHIEDGPLGFSADGDGELHLTLPVDHDLAEDESLLLVYHSDDLDHSDQPGDLGINAHIQLILVKPESGAPEERSAF